jgi:hypothetical protein
MQVYCTVCTTLPVHLQNALKMWRGWVRGGQGVCDVQYVCVWREWWGWGRRSPHFLAVGVLVVHLPCLAGVAATAMECGYAEQ